MDPLDIKQEEAGNWAPTEMISESGNKCQIGLSIKKESLEESDEIFTDFEAATDQIKKEIKVENVKSEDFNPFEDHGNNQDPLA